MFYVTYYKPLEVIKNDECADVTFKNQFCREYKLNLHIWIVYGTTGWGKSSVNDYNKSNPYLSIKPKIHQISDFVPSQTWEFSRELCINGDEYLHEIRKYWKNFKKSP